MAKHSHQSTSTGFGVASLILGIFGVLLFLAPYIAVIFNILAIVFGVMQKKRGQTSVGTAGLIIGIAGLCLSMIVFIISLIAIVAFMGALSPDKFVAEKCVLSSGLACLDSSFDEKNGVNVYIHNAAGFDMSAVSANLQGVGCNAANDGGPVSLGNGQAMTFTFSDCTTLTGRYKGILTVTYTSQATGLVHTNTGDIVVDAS